MCLEQTNPNYMRENTPKYILQLNRKIKMSSDVLCLAEISLANSKKFPLQPLAALVAL